MTTTQAGNLVFKTPTRKYYYSPVSESKIPQGIRFDVAGRNSGQMVENAFGGFSRSEHNVGDLYFRCTDRSSQEVSFYKFSRTALVK